MPTSEIFCPMEAVFPSRQWKSLFWRPAAKNFLFSWNGVLLFIFFETIIAISRRPIFIKLLFLLVETVFFSFFIHWIEGKQVFGPVKKHFFSTNPSFWLADMEFCSIQNLALLFRNFSAGEYHETEIRSATNFFNCFNS